MPVIAAIGAKVTIALTAAGATATVGAIGGAMVSGAVTGSLIGAGVAAVKGEDIGKGALLGAASGAISGGVVSGGSMIANAATGGAAGTSAAGQVAAAENIAAGGSGGGLLSDPKGYLTSSTPGQIATDVSTQAAGTMGGQAAIMGAKDEEEEKPAPGTTGNVFADYLNRTPGAIDAYLEAKKINPKWSAEEWARHHYEASRDKDPNLYWGLNRDEKGGLLQTDQDVDPDVMFMEENPGAWDSFYAVRKINPKWTLPHWVREHKKARGLEVESFGDYRRRVYGEGKERERHDER